MNVRAEPARKAMPESCFRCGSGLTSAALCFHCEAVQPLPTNADYFRLFGLPRAYALDTQALNSAYEKLSFAVHPDFFAARTAAALAPARTAAGAAAPAPSLAEAQRIAAEINEGYRTLRDEGARGAYLLGLLAEGRELDKRALPAGFLQRMFVLQERIDELDGGAPPEARRSLRGEVEALRRDTLAERARRFAALESPPASEELQAIQSNLNQEKYLRRLLERLAV